MGGGHESAGLRLCHVKQAVEREEEEGEVGLSDGQVFTASGPA